MFRFQRERTPFQAVIYGLYLYFLGLSFRGVSYALDPFVNRSHTAVWKWVQRYEPHRVFDVRRVQAFLVDETYVEVGSFEAWVWVAVESVHRYILGVYLSRHQNMIVAELFLKPVDHWGWSTDSIHVREEPDGEGQPVPEGQGGGVRRLLSVHEEGGVRPV